MASKGIEKLIADAERAGCSAPTFFVKKASLLWRLLYYFISWLVYGLTLCS